MKQAQNLIDDENDACAVKHDLWISGGFPLSEEMVLGILADACLVTWCSPQTDKLLSLFNVIL